MIFLLYLHMTKKTLVRNCNHKVNYEPQFIVHSMETVGKATK